MFPWGSERCFMGGMCFRMECVSVTPHQRIVCGSTCPSYLVWKVTECLASCELHSVPCLQFEGCLSVVEKNMDFRKWFYFKIIYHNTLWYTSVDSIANCVYVYIMAFNNWTPYKMQIWQIWKFVYIDIIHLTVPMYVNTSKTDIGRINLCNLKY